MFLFSGISKTSRKPAWLHRLTEYTGEQILLNDTSRKRRRKNLKRRRKRKLNLILHCVQRMKYCMV